MKMMVVVFGHRGLAHLKSQILDLGPGKVIMQSEADPAA